MQLPEPIGLRAIQEDDLSLLHRIYFSTRESELAPLNWSAAEKFAFVVSQFTLQQRHYQTHFPNADFQIVQHGTTDIGRLYIDWHQEDLRLIDIALLPEWRGQGIGRKILRSLLAMADQYQKSILLQVEANNPVLSLYRRLGFKTINSGVYLLLVRPPLSLVA